MRAWVFSAVVVLVGCAGASERRPRGAWAPPVAYAPIDPWSLGAISFADAQVGKRYCWGGTGPECFDCSGLVQAAWRYAGIRLPRTAHALARELEEVSPEAARPGDILWWPGHVGLYLGNGWMVDALGRREGVVRRRAPQPDRILRPLPSTSLARRD